jgi:hypothetical protein
VNLACSLVEEKVVAVSVVGVADKKVGLRSRVELALALLWRCAIPRRAAEDAKVGHRWFDATPRLERCHVVKDLRWGPVLEVDGCLYS